MLQVSSVTPVPDFLLRLVFSNGEQRQFDMRIKGARVSWHKFRLIAFE